MASGGRGLGGGAGGGGGGWLVGSLKVSMFCPFLALRPAAPPYCRPLLAALLFSSGARVLYWAWLLCVAGFYRKLVTFLFFVYDSICCFCFSYTLAVFFSLPIGVGYVAFEYVLFGMLCFLIQGNPISP